ncbi:MAG TPA: hypothetical protein VJT09_11565 [Pyrinomonadaceae bacterium]|nr:hypothetical protein [Pyrinomonadaceae bacterium]
MSLQESQLQTAPQTISCSKCGLVSVVGALSCARCGNALPCTVDPISQFQPARAAKGPEPIPLRIMDNLFTVMSLMGLYYYYFDRYGARTIGQKQFRFALLLFGSVGALVTWTLRLLRKHTSLLMLAFLLLTGALSIPVSAQEARQRPARSLTSEDLLNRPVIYVPQPLSSAGAPSSNVTARSAGSTSYRDPAGAFALNLPNGNWRPNPRGGSAGRIYNQRSFRRVESEGYTSATANVYVVAGGTNIPVVDPSHLSAEDQREFAAAIAARFLSSNASLVSVSPVSINAHTQLRIIADQTIARRVAVRAAINVFERSGRLYVVVCCASPETFDLAQREFEIITSSLASSVARS